MELVAEQGVIGSRWVGSGLVFDGSFGLKCDGPIHTSAGSTDNLIRYPVAMWVMFSSSGFEDEQVLFWTGPASPTGAYYLKKTSAGKLAVVKEGYLADTTDSGSKTFSPDTLYFITADSHNVFVNGVQWVGATTFLQYPYGFYVGSSSFKGTVFDFASFYTDFEITLVRHLYMYNGGKGIYLPKKRLSNIPDGSFGQKALHSYWQFGAAQYDNTNGFVPIVKNTADTLYLTQTSAGSRTYKNRQGSLVT
jgi:hypothetical protein